MNNREAYPIIFYKEYRYFYNEKYKDETIDKVVSKHPRISANKIAKVQLKCFRGPALSSE